MMVPSNSSRAAPSATYSCSFGRTTSTAGWRTSRSAPSTGAGSTTTVGASGSSASRSSDRNLVLQEQTVGGSDLVEVGLYVAFVDLSVRAGDEGDTVLAVFVEEDVGLAGLDVADVDVRDVDVGVPEAVEDAERPFVDADLPEERRLRARASGGDGLIRPLPAVVHLVWEIVDRRWNVLHPNGRPGRREPLVGLGESVQHRSVETTDEVDVDASETDDGSHLGSHAGASPRNLVDIETDAHWFEVADVLAEHA